MDLGKGHACTRPLIKMPLFLLSMLCDSTNRYTHSMDFHLPTAHNWFSKYRMEITTYAPYNIFRKNSIIISISFTFFSRFSSLQIPLAFISHAWINIRRSKIFVYLKNSFNRKQFISGKKFNNAQKMLESIVLLLLLSSQSWFCTFCNI